jgi:predicted Zn-dependent peptidase
MEITDKELKNSKEQIKGNLMLSLESTNSRMSRNGKHELILGYHRTLDDMVESIDNVSKEDVNSLIQMIFIESCSASLVSPQGELPKGIQ